MDWKNRTVFITGGSRGIGLSIAERVARAGAKVVIAAKTTEPHPRLEGTIYTAAERVEALGGKALAVPVDVRNEEDVATAVQKAVAHFGGIDVLVNNASAIDLSPLEFVSAKRLDLMLDINVRGAMICAAHCLPALKKSANPHIVSLSPPIDLSAKWFEAHSPYTISKYAMTMAAMGMAGELKQYGIASNCLWPRTTIATAAVRNLLGGEDMVRASRSPQIVADAFWVIVNKKDLQWTGQCLIDEDVLREHGVTEFEGYSIDPSRALMPDLFLPPLK